jgi:hypothetical protein
VRSALGVMNLTDTLPAASTYHLFRKRIAQNNRENDVDLFKQCMQHITRSQILEFNVIDKQIDDPILNLITDINLNVVST